MCIRDRGKQGRWLDVVWPVMMAKARAKAVAGQSAKEANDAILGEKIAKLQAAPLYVVSSDH